MLEGAKKIVDSILGDGLREHLHKHFEARAKGEKYEIPTDGMLFEPTTPPEPITLPPGVVYAELVNETPKAVNLKVYLDSSEYKMQFNFKPSMMLWMPKFAVERVIDDKHWKIKVPKMWAENLDKSFLYLKSYLIKNYGYNWDEINSKLYKVVLLKK